jgi:hypothetical protein
MDLNIQIPPSLDTFPPEILSQICDFACTDGGITARALSRVSKYIGQVTYPFLWRSLVISGLSQLSRLETHLSKNPNHTKLIEDLFFSDKAGKASRSPTLQRASASGSLKEFARLDVLERKEGEQLVNVFRRLLPKMAPTLRTMCLICFNTRSAEKLVHVLWSTSLPNLTELTVSSRTHFRAPPVSLPSVRRLHFPAQGARHIKSVATDFPNLTHLHLGRSDIFVTRFLEKAFNVELERRYPRMYTWGNSAILPPGLQYVYLEFPKDHWCMNECRYECQSKDELDSLEKLVDSVRVLRQGGVGGSYTYSRAKADWYATRRGQGGFWPLNDDEVELVEIGEEEDGTAEEVEAKGIRGLWKSCREFIVNR